MLLQWYSVLSQAEGWYRIRRGICRGEVVDGLKDLPSVRDVHERQEQLYRFLQDEKNGMDGRRDHDLKEGCWTSV